MVERQCFEGILRGAHNLWMQVCSCSERTTHLAFYYDHEFKHVAFCGHELTFGSCKITFGTMAPWNEESQKEPTLCPLCVDRLVNLGGGLCAEVCLLCGHADGVHNKGCVYRRLQNKELVAKLGGLASSEKGS